MKVMTTVEVTNPIPICVNVTKVTLGAYYRGTRVSDMTPMSHVIALNEFVVYRSASAKLKSEVSATTVSWLYSRFIRSTPSNQDTMS